MASPRICLASLTAALMMAGSGSLWAQPYQPDERTLLLDHLDEAFVPDGKLCTRPAVISPGEQAGGCPTGGSFVPGVFGQALQMRGLMQISYPAAGNINLSAGRAEFWVALSFDAAEKIKNPGVLTNQLFLTIWGGAGSMVCVYSTLSQTCVGVWDKQRQLVCYGGFPGFWKAGEWHHLELRWGRQLELWCDGARQVSQEWAGLFGPLDVRPEDLRMTFGSHIGWSDVHSEYALDEVRILGPGGEDQPDYPVMTVPRIAPPVIDGRLEDAEWAGAACTTGFVALHEHALAPEQTVVYAGWDAQALYLAYECLNPHKRPLVARLTERDSGVYMEDAVDFLCRPDPDGYPYYHFIASAIGTVYDSRVDPTRGAAPHDPRFDPPWTVRTSQEPARWIVEARIPFAALDGRAAPRDGERWRVNFCRDGETLNLYSSWAYAAGNFHAVAHFGELVFSASDRAIRLSALGDPAMGKVAAQMALTGFLFDPLVTVTGRLVGTDAKAIVEQQNRLADYRAVTISAPTLVTGLYNLTLRATTDAGVMYYQRLPFRVRKAYDISVAGYPYEGKLWVTANIGGLVEIPAGLVARSRLMQEDRTVATCETAHFVRGIGEAALDIADLPPGKYLIRSDAVTPDGKVLASAEAEFEQFPRPPWWHSQAGADNTVPAPWDPVRREAGTIRVWGREYRCGGGALPMQILNQGEEMLTAPVTLQITAGGQTTDLARLATVETAARDDAVVFTGRARLGDLDITSQTTTEFDGLQRYDLTLHPAAPTEVSSLSLEVPIKSQYASFLCPSNGISAPASRLGREPWRSAFLPQVWVGNDDLGLAWFAETDQHWRPRDDRMLEVSPEGDRTVIRCRIIRQPWRLERPVTLTFGLMATPVKPVPVADPFWFRFGNVDEILPREALRYPGAGNVRLEEGTLEFWLAPARDLTGSWWEVAGLTGKNGRLILYYYPGRKVLQLVVKPAGEEHLAEAPDVELVPGPWTHVALTWKDRIELFVGGKRSATLPLPLPPALGDPPARLRLSLGSAMDYEGYSRIAVDEVRVSDIVRYDGDTIPVPDAPFAPDAHTLLLDHLDETFRPDGEDAETRAQVISGASGELGGVPSLGCRFREGKFGQGLEIVSPDPLTPEQTVQRFGFNASLFWWLIEENARTTGWPPPLFTEPLIKDLRERAKRYRDLGLRPVPYMGYPALGAPGPLASQFGSEWSRLPLSTQPYEPPKGHYFWDMCPHSGFADYMAAGTQWVLEDLGFEGCYTDGLAQVYPCQNTHHGCGYRDEQGDLHSTWPLFATREMLKRMYRLIHAHSPGGYIVNHVSFNLIIPTMSFTDVYYSGEHEQYEDLLKFRVRWQGKQWGIWPILLGGDAHIYEPMHMTYCLLHGVSVWPQGFTGRNDALRKTANLWHTFDRFGYREAEWIPYYQAQDRLVKTSDEQVKASLYLHRGKRALIIVGNLKPEVVHAELSLNLAAMGLADAAARNALTDQPLPLTNGTVPLRLRPHSMVLVWVG